MGNNYNASLCNNIAKLRKELGLTQENLADKIGVSFQAVSKWENGASCPDISVLPLIAEIFNVSLDDLFGYTNGDSKEDIPFKDDGKLRMVMFEGRNYIEHTDYEKKDFNIILEGNAKDVECHFNLSCQNIEGVAVVGGNLNSGDIGKEATIGGDLISKNIGGSAVAGGNVVCKDINGNVDAGGNVKANVIHGSVSASGNIAIEK